MPHAGVIAAARRQVAWPVAAAPEEVSGCVSAIYADTGVTDAGSPGYALTSVTDSIGDLAFTNVASQKRTAPPAIGWGGGSGYLYRNTVDSDFRLFAGGGEHNTAKGSFVLRCKRVGKCGVFSTSFGVQSWFQITATSVIWTYGSSGDGYKTNTIAHGQDTSQLHIWGLRFRQVPRSGLFPLYQRFTVFVDGVSLGESGDSDAESYGVSDPARYGIGGTSGFDDQITAAFAFNRSLSDADFASLS